MASMKLVFFIVVALCSTFPLRALSQQIPKVDAIYQFGDSISDTGNLIRESPIGEHTTFARLPYRQTYFHKPTGRCSNGLLMIDFFARYLNLPLLDAYLNEAGNFTHGASGTGTNDQAAGLVASEGNGQGNSGRKSRKLYSRGPKPNDICNYCKEKGQWKSECPKKMRQQENSESADIADGDTCSEEDYVEHRVTLGGGGGPRPGKISQHSQSESESESEASQSSPLKSVQSSLALGRQVIFGNSPQRKGREDKVAFALSVGEVDISEPPKGGVARARKKHCQAVCSNLVPQSKPQGCLDLQIIRSC
uniref:Uncharacterized protein n=1 Tax=Chenopodium quinoa TaxID=63459 RepID=A0A803MJB0_CHEQI